jgi:hypothetical protein
MPLRASISIEGKMLWRQKAKHAWLWRFSDQGVFSVRGLKLGDKPTSNHSMLPGLAYES